MLILYNFLAVMSNVTENFTKYLPILSKYQKCKSCNKKLQKTLEKLKNQVYNDRSEYL